MVWFQRFCWSPFTTNADGQAASQPRVTEWMPCLKAIPPQVQDMRFASEAGFTAAPRTDGPQPQNDSDPCVPWPWTRTRGSEWIVLT